MKLITGNECSACEAVKAYIKSNNLDVEIIEQDTRAWREYERENLILWVPILVKDWERYMGDDIYNQLK